MPLFKSILIALALMIIPAKADDPHSHGVNVPDWYDSTCCSNNDCKPVKDEDIDFGVNAEGRPVAIYKPTGNEFLLKDLNGNRYEGHKDSKDERYHICINPISKVSLCFYNRGGV